jgi:ATP-dependent DNA helicase RecG
MTRQSQLCLFSDPPTVEELLGRREDQWFDRKSIRIGARELADRMIGFANADGGRIGVGIHGGDIEGVGDSSPHLNDLLQAAADFSVPPVRHAVLFVDCTNRRGDPDRLLVLDIEASEQIHRNVRGDCFLRVGDENRRLGPNEERELAFDKGEAVFDGTVVKDLVRADLDLDAIQEYADRIGARDLAALMRSRGLYYDAPHRTGVTQAGWLLFGEVPPIWSYIRYLRYAGTTAETGVRSNLTEDIRLDGMIPTLIEKAKALLTEQLGTVIRLRPSGRFERVPALPEFAWLEAIVNAVTHRSYSMQGDGIRVTQFDDRLEVTSPGRLPGLVRVQNIRNSRFSRNPHIARVLAEMTGYVRELNEGVQRMFEEMARYGLPEPEYRVTETSVRVILASQLPPDRNVEAEVVRGVLVLLERRLGRDRMQQLLGTFRERRQLRTADLVNLLGVSAPTARNYLRLLEETGLVTRSHRSSTDPTATWRVTDSPFWSGTGTY